jgi:hypothetical protein
MAPVIIDVPDLCIPITIKPVDFLIGWLVADCWPVEGSGVKGWGVEGWTVEGWIVEGWTVEGWIVEGWTVEGWTVEGWTVEGWTVEGLVGDGSTGEGPSLGSSVTGWAISKSSIVACCSIMSRSSCLVSCIGCFGICPTLSKVTQYTVIVQKIHKIS